MKYKIERGRPKNTEGRLIKEIRVYDLLDSLGIEYDRIDHNAVDTMEACSEIDTVLAPAVICKNLFLCNSQRTKFYLLLIRGDRRFDTKSISAQIGSSRLSFAPHEYMEKYLDNTPGSASVLGLMNDIDGKVKLLIDREVLNEEYFGCHPCINTSSLRLRTSDVFVTFLRAVNHSYTEVTAD
ncbi:MAG: prolyl-tRNA synthetase associated domain-containing protein [Oscillospiraceae bacterium]|jgi:putative ybaK/prolyl-tRNA synthetase domain protein|nr:MAG: prolyl-tRNA synthetase associated domain-containing protein [Oscillospiraceae bacterium]